MTRKLYLIKDNEVYSFHDFSSDSEKIVIKFYSIYEPEKNLNYFTRTAANSFWQDRRKEGFEPINTGHILGDFFIDWKISQKFISGSGRL